MPRKTDPSTTPEPQIGEQSMPRRAAVSRTRETVSRAAAAVRAPERARRAAAMLPGVPADTAVLIRRARFASARTAFASDAAMAEALGADRSRAARWKAGEPMDDAR